MRLDNEGWTSWIHVPSTCTIVIIAGIHVYCLHTLKPKNNVKSSITIPTLGKYLDKVDRVMTEVDRITDNISQIPVAAFIFRDKESDEIKYSETRYIGILNRLKIIYLTNF